jgi:hypothetical protein
MQRLEDSGSVRPIYGSLGVKRLNTGLNQWPHQFLSTGLLIVTQEQTEIPNNNFESSEEQKHCAIVIQGKNTAHKIDRLGDPVTLTTGNSTAEEVWACDVGAPVAL